MRKLTICVLLASCVYLAACSPATMSNSAPTTGQSQVVQPPVAQPLAESTKFLAVTPSPATPKIVAPMPVESAAEETPLFQQAIAGTPVTFEMVAEGDAMVAKRVPPFTIALSAADRPPALLDELPAEARTAFQQAVAKPGPSDLYLVIYGGRQPSERYDVKIVSVTQENGKLTVLYRVEGPPPGQGAADVITYPYAIARVSGVVIDPADVTFVEQKSHP